LVGFGAFRFLALQTQTVIFGMDDESRQKALENLVPEVWIKKHRGKHCARIPTEAAYLSHAYDRYGSCGWLYSNGDDVFFADFQPGDFPDDFRIVPGASDQLIDEIVDAGVRRDERLANGTMLHFSFAEE
jgi:hypothetical protein